MAIQMNKEQLDEYTEQHFERLPFASIYEVIKDE